MHTDDRPGNERANLDFVDGFSSAEVALIVSHQRRCDLRNIDLDRSGTLGPWCVDNSVAAGRDEHRQAGRR